MEAEARAAVSEAIALAEEDDEDGEEEGREGRATEARAQQDEDKEAMADRALQASRAAWEQTANNPDSEGLLAFWQDQFQDLAEDDARARAFGSGVAGGLIFLSAQCHSPAPPSLLPARERVALAFGQLLNIVLARQRRARVLRAIVVIIDAHDRFGEALEGSFNIENLRYSKKRSRKANVRALASESADEVKADAARERQARLAADEATLAAEANTAREVQKSAWLASKVEEGFLDGQGGAVAGGGVCVCVCVCFFLDVADAIFSAWPQSATAYLKSWAVG